MDFVDVYFFSSPASVFVAVVTLAFLLNQARPRFARQKQPEVLSYPSTSDESVSEASVIKEPEVPKDYWSSREVFELERRALFSKTWLYLAHKNQFAKPGAYQSFDIADFPIFLIRGKDNLIRAFHNVCRHRAYTITRKESGASTVLGCRYHGWSYDTTGRLVKAPQFDDVPGFDKSQNSLFEIHVHTTEHGWVFVNLDAGEPAPFEESVALGLARFADDAGVGGRSEWVAGRTLTGKFNWKLGMSARHCADISAHLEQTVLEVLPPSLTTKLVKIITRKDNRAKTSLFPNSLLYSFKNADLWLSLTFLPASETTTRIRYDLFGTPPKAGTNENDLGNAVEKVIQTLIGGIESEFQSISTKSVENSAVTRQILARLQEHSKMEKIRGSLIFPAMRQPKGSALFQLAEQLCKEIDCSGPGSQSAELDW